MIPESFKSFNNFVAWKTTDRNGKKIKLPIDPKTGSLADTVNPATWADFATASNFANSGQANGIGFVFTDADPFFFLDIDKCLEPCGTKWSPLAVDLMNRLPGAAIEVSQSGTGLHIFGAGIMPPKSCKNIPLNIELYTSQRFVALTGDRASGDAIDCTHALANLVETYFPPRTTAADVQWADEPVEGWNGIQNDDELIKKMLSTSGGRAMFGGSATARHLWDADEEALAQHFPNLEGDSALSYDASSVDAALAQHLAFWTGNNPARIERLMRRSSLARDKWDDREDYMERTILRACSMQTEFHGVRESVEAAPLAIETAAVAPGAQMVAGFQYLAAPQQMEHFAGCVYVQDDHRVLVPSGDMLKPDQFNAVYGGYVFQLDDGGSGKTTKKAWEAFTESQVVRFPKVQAATFLPKRPPGDIFEQDGRTTVNIYKEIKTPSAPGDVTPFLEHVAKLLPDEGDRAIVLAYMAAVVQHKGVKFQWAPLLQGVEGNGKTFLTRCVAAAIGKLYTHMPPAAELAEKFNAWLFNVLFIGVEDVYVPETKREILETLKPMITNDQLARRAMQSDQVMRDVCANFMLNSNHKDAIRTHANDRRFAMFFTAQQSVEDLARDGMIGDYFFNLYNWANGGGYAAITHFLQTYAIPDELNPAGRCNRAPHTTSTDEAVEVSRGGVEQAILEAVDEGRPGFANGWISSMALETLLDSMRAARAIPMNKRKTLLHELGYIHHPALVGGRMTSLSTVDGGRPRLFVKRGHLSASLTSPTEVARVYQEAQTSPAGAANVTGQMSGFKTT